MSKDDLQVKAVISKDDSLPYEFLPSLLEVVERPTNKWCLGVVGTLFCLLVSIILWAFLGKIDIVVTANAHIVPDGKTKVIQSPASGSVTVLHVREGDSVKKDDLLLVVDTQNMEYDERYLLQNVSICEAELAAYQSVLTGTAIQLNAIQEPVIKSKVDLILNENEKHLAQVALYGENINSIKMDLQILKNNKSILRSSLQSLKHKQEVYAQLVEDGGVDQQQLVSLEQARDRAADDFEGMFRASREYKVAEENLKALEEQILVQEKVVAQAQADMELLNDEIARSIETTNLELKTQDLNIDKYEQQIKLISAEESVFVANYRTQIMTKQIELQEAIDNYRYQLDKVENSLSVNTIRSPVDGIVSKIDIGNVGGFVTAAQPLLYIIPNADELVIESYVASKDVGTLEVGQNVRIKLDAYQYSKYGELKGTVKYISPDTFSHDVYGPVYIVHVYIQEQAADNGMEAKVGMTGTVEIQTGTRTIVEYFFEPITEALQGSMRQA